MIIALSKMVKMKTLADFDFKDKIVLLRTDLNSDVKNGKVLESERIRAASETIIFLQKKKAKVVVIAHQGRPGKEDFLSLEQHSRFLNKFVKIKFVSDLIGEKAESAIKDLGSGEAILLDNVRMEGDEFKPELGEKNKLFNLTRLCEIYVNDAFSVCHRNEASIVLFPRYMKSCAGIILEKEVKALEKINVKDCLYILGGAKPEDNLKLLKGNRVLACGLFGQTCLIAKGKNFGAQNEYLKKELILNSEILGKLKSKLVNVETPVDFAVNINGKRKELKLEEFPNEHEIFDIGKNTQEKYVAEIKKARAIYMKGPAGDCSEKQFSKGTFTILKAISESKAFSVIGGGHLSDAIRDSRISEKKFGHISLSGGALLSYISGEKLPGLEVLK